MRKQFLVCIHDATPAYARETQAMLRDLAPLLGRRLSLGVVPDWHGKWPLAAHRDYCRLLQDAAEELLLHGYFHRRHRGWGSASVIAGACDEMNGLNAAETRSLIARGQGVFTDVFGTPPRGFVAPGWQRGLVRARTLTTLRLEYLLGFFSLTTSAGERVRIATWTWDCGRWAWLGHVGYGLGRLSTGLPRRVPALAIHPLDVQRGFWPKILRLTRELVDDGYEPATAAGLLDPGELVVRAALPSAARRRCRDLPPSDPGAHVRRQPCNRHGEAMVTSILDAVMQRRARRLMTQLRPWLPSEGPVLDLGSGTGHLSSEVERELGVEVVTADVSDIHVVGRPPVLIADGALPFETGTYTASLLVFMLAYPNDPAGVLAEAARVTRGPIILVQSLHANRFGYAWLRVREFLWTIVAFHASKLLGYVPPQAKFAMNTRRFYTARDLHGEVAAARLRIRSRLERPVLPGRSLVVAMWSLEHDE